MSLRYPRTEEGKTRLVFTATLYFVILVKFSVFSGASSVNLNAFFFKFKMFQFSEDFPGYIFKKKNATAILALKFYTKHVKEQIRGADNFVSKHKKGEK